MQLPRSPEPPPPTATPADDDDVEFQFDEGRTPLACFCSIENLAAIAFAEPLSTRSPGDDRLGAAAAASSPSASLLVVADVVFVGLAA